MKKFLFAALLVGSGILGWCVFTTTPLRTQAQEKAAAGAALDRTVLPIPEPKIPHSTVFDARNAKAPPRFEVKAPAAAPNVLVVLIDDMGFGMSSAFGGPISMPTLDRLANVFINLKNKSHKITAELEIPEKGASGVILAQAGRFGGWSLYLQEGKPVYTYNFLGLERFSIKSPDAIPVGKATLRFEFAYDGGGLGKGGVGTLLVNGKKAGEGQIGRTQLNVFSADETADVGVDEATPVTEDYKEGDNKFTGRIKKVTIDLK